MQVKILLSNKNFKQVNSLKDIGFQEAQLAVETGMSGAQRMFQDFLQNKITKYKSDRNLPAVDGVSNLGIHFRFGTISIRECFREAFKLLSSLPSLSSLVPCDTICHYFFNS
jgi:deoxyribodipyrimidine photo-lyase